MKNSICCINRRNPPRTFDSDQGSVVVEFSICSVVLVLLIFGVMDLGLSVLDYHILVNSGHEGVLFASRVPGLEPGTEADCRPATCSSITHARIQERIRGIVRSRTRSGWGNRLSIESSYDPLNDKRISIFISSPSRSRTGVIPLPDNKLRFTGIYVY